MSKRLDPSWIVVESIENLEHDRCVDLFARPDGSFGFEEFRRDPEDAGAWTPVACYSGLRQASRAEALGEATRRVAWLAPTPVDAACHCGAVRLAVSAAPETVTACTCSICRRYGVLWAYYPVAEVRVACDDGASEAYAWGRRSIAFHRCRTCGCVTHWAPVARAEDRMGVNARLMPLEVLARARVRRLDGAHTERYLDE